MATPPTRVQYVVPPSGNYGTAPASFTTAALTSIAVGDLLVVGESSEVAGTPTTVTPTLSAGAATWTLQANQTAGGTNQSGAKLWTGVVTTAATNVTVSLSQPTSASQWWGMSASQWTNHGGVGVVFQGNNGTGSGTPSVAATCSANSAVQCLVNDWNAADGTTRTWLTINGAAETESLYFRDSLHHTVYGGYRTDTGAAGSITQGLSAPTGQRWVLVGVEILGMTSGTAARAPLRFANRAAVMRAVSY